MDGKFEFKHAMLILAVVLLVLQYIIFGFNLIPWEHRLGNLSGLLFGVYLGMRISDAWNEKEKLDASA